MTVVITGASGNVGSALLRRLAADGGGDVTALARRMPDGGSALSPLATWEGCDIGAVDATERLVELFTGADAVVHLAWGSTHRGQAPRCGEPTCSAAPGARRRGARRGAAGGLRVFRRGVPSAGALGGAAGVPGGDHVGRRSLPRRRA